MKVGDKVVIRKSYYENRHSAWIESMDALIGQEVTVELTSIDNKLEAVCQQCVNTLVGVLSGKEMPKKSVFAAEVVKRGTTSF